jgi:hypothetical protein
MAIGVDLKSEGIERVPDDLLPAPQEQRVINMKSPAAEWKQAKKGGCG